jgi:hypothetical protein
MSTGGLRERDEALLDETRHAAEAALDGKVILPRNPAWGQSYDPLFIMLTTGSPEVFRLALVNQRIAMHPGEAWGKCANCSRLYLVEAYGEVCSPECFAAYCNYLENPGSPLP